MKHRFKVYKCVKNSGIEACDWVCINENEHIYKPIGVEAEEDYLIIEKLIDNNTKHDGGMADDGE